MHNASYNLISTPGDSLAILGAESRKMKNSVLEIQGNHVLDYALVSIPVARQLHIHDHTCAQGRCAIHETLVAHAMH